MPVEYVLMDNKGRIVTDKIGLIRIWYNREQAKRDAIGWMKALGRLRVVEYPGARWAGIVSLSGRIEV